jgi:hypothetical protein
MEDLRTVFVCLLLAPAWASGGGGGVTPTLTEQHTNTTKTVRFRTPPDWTVETRAGVPEVTEARGGALILRLVHREGETGLDSQHVDCMLIRLGAELQSQPRVEYEYDFVGGQLGGRRLLESAFVVEYDEPVHGERKWRQRNITVVGAGESVCLIGYSPQPLWKRSKDARKLLDAVLGSVEFRPWR